MRYIALGLALLGFHVVVRAQETDAREEQRQDVPNAPPASVALESVDPRTTSPSAPETTRSLLLLPTATRGIDPIVAQVANHEANAATTRLGYTTHLAEGLAQNDTHDGARALTPAELWRLTEASGSDRGMQVRVWAADGVYVIEIVVASMDRTGPFFGRDTAQANDLRTTLARLVENTLPPPSRWQTPSAVPAPTETRASPLQPTVRPSSVRNWLSDPHTNRRAPTSSNEPFRRFSLGIATEASIGISVGGFYNHFFGMRFDVRLTRDLAVGIYAAYVNLEGRNSRENNIAFAIFGEDRIRFSARSPLMMPLRVAVGYLPFNGPTLRLSAGLGYRIDDAWEVTLDVLVPAFYFLSDRVGIAYNPGLELLHRF